jgi:hypothetical protein
MQYNSPNLLTHLLTVAQYSRHIFLYQAALKFTGMEVGEGLPNPLKDVIEHVCINLDMLLTKLCQVLDVYMYENT